MLASHKRTKSTELLLPLQLLPVYCYSKAKYFNIILARSEWIFQQHE